MVKREPDTAKSLRLPAALKRRLTQAAARNRRSANAEILVAIERWLEEQEREAKGEKRR
jgi:predicted DNA-binding protein